MIKKNLKTIKIFILLISVFFINADLALTQEVNSKLPSQKLDITIQNPLKGGTKSLPELLALILDEIVIPIASIIIVISIIWVGFKFVTAQGNSNEINKQKDNLFYILIGAGIILGAKGISLAIQGTFSKLINF